jgi:dihydrodipicolinate synthase/N-acetylneuraminate lyase
VNRDSVDWKGFIPAITTPFTPSGELDLDGWLELVEWMAAQGMHGIAVGGTTGEWFSLAPDERVELFRTAVEQVDGRMPVLAGSNALTPGEAIGYARAALECGCDGILLTPPPYVVPSPAEVVAWYGAVSDAVPLPLCVYNWPRGTGVDLDAATLSELAAIDTIVAIKNSTGNVASFLDGFFAVKDQVRYFGAPMTELGITLIREHGLDGTIGAGAVLGSTHPDFFNHAWAGDREAALACGARDRLLFEHWINPDYSPRFGSPQAIMKAALDVRGLPGGPPRPPLLPLTPEERLRVEATMDELGLVGVAS